MPSCGNRTLSHFRTQVSHLGSNIVKNEFDNLPGQSFFIHYPIAPFIGVPMAVNYLPEFKDKIALFIVSILAFCT